MISEPSLDPIEQSEINLSDQEMNEYEKFINTGIYSTEEPEMNELRQILIGCRIAACAGDRILKCLRWKIPSLPKTCRTFLRTQDAAYEVQKMEDVKGLIGEYLYLGIEQQLQKCVNTNFHQELIELIVNIDWFKTFKSFNYSLAYSLSSVSPVDFL